MNKIVFATIATLTFASFAEQKAVQTMTGPDGKPAPVHHMNPKELQAMKYRRTGGMIVKPGTVNGKIVYVNAQSRAPIAWLKENADLFKGGTQIATEVEAGAFEFPSPKISGNATLFVIDDPKMPSLLSAPESRWVMVNVATLSQGAGEKPQFFKARVQKELTRGFSILAGSQSSNYPNSLLGCITKPEQLDEFMDCRLPVDIKGRFAPYVAGYGITPGVEVSYRKACREGWAPAPTNDVQKKIWDDIHAAPTKPIIIKPETKKQ